MSNEVVEKVRNAITRELKNKTLKEEEILSSKSN